MGFSVRMVPGKTTTIKMLAGLLLPSNGSITINVHDLGRFPERGKRVTGYIPDRPFLYEKLTGDEYLRFIASLYLESGTEEVMTRAEKIFQYFSAISAPAGPWLPAGWSSGLLTTYLLDGRVDWLLAGLLFTTPFVLYFAGELAMRRWFFAGFTKSQESFGGHRNFRPTRSFPGTWAWVFRKELKYFLRDSSEWSQLFMVGALIVVYLYNFKVLPLDRAPMSTEYLTHLIAFANIGLVGFMAASLSARFVYPSMGSERGAFYLIGSASLTLGRFLLYKYLFYLPPFTMLTVLLVVVSNHLLGIHGPMLWISLFLSLLTTWTTVALALGFGAWFADFKSENRAAAMGPGAIIFLFCAVLYQLAIIGLGIFPIYHLVKGWLATSVIPAADAFFLCAWAAGAAGISILLAITICRRSLAALRT